MSGFSFNQNSTWLGLFMTIVTIAYAFVPLFNIAFPVNSVIFIAFGTYSMTLLFCPDTIIDIIKNKFIKTDITTKETTVSETIKEIKANIDEPK